MRLSETKRFEMRFAIKEATETFLALNEAFKPSTFHLVIFRNSVIELRVKVLTKAEKLQFIQTAESIVTKGVVIECYYHRVIRKYCIDIKWRLE